MAPPATTLPSSTPPLMPELILIEKCLGREVPHGGLPADAGAIVMNVTSVSLHTRKR